MQSRHSHSQIPQPPPHLRNHRLAERRGHQDGQWYAVYHARDYGDNDGASAFDARNARICKLNVEDGIITAERYEDRV